VNRSTVIGFIIGVGLVFAAIYLQLHNIQNYTLWTIFFNLPSFLLVFGSTMAATFISFPLSEVLDSFRSFFYVFKKDPPDVEENISDILYVINQMRQGGRNVLEQEIPKLRNFFLRDAVQLIIEGYHDQEVREILEDRIVTRLRRERAESEIFSNMSKISPAFGMVGTIIGLMITLNTMDPSHMDNMGSNMSLALITTFYGVLLAYMIFRPIAVKLDRRTQEEVFSMQVIRESIPMVSGRWHPIKAKDFLTSFVRPGRRNEIITS